MSDKKTYQQEEQIRRYLQDEMTSAERNAFEREMQRDPFLPDAMDGLSVFPAEEIISDIQSLKTEIQKSRRSNQKYIWYAAASVLVIVVSTFILLNIEEKTNPVLTENIRKVESDAQKEIISEPQNLQANDTEQKTIITEDSKDAETEHEIVTPEVVDMENEFVSAETKKTESTFTPNLAEQLKLKKSFALTENLKLAKVDSQQKAVSQELAEKAASEEKPIIQTVSTKGRQRTVEALPVEESALQGVSVDKRANISRIVSGIVTDSDGYPLPGVTVVVKGTSKGAITDIDGKYIIPNVQDSNSLVYSFVGMKTQEIPNTSNIQVNVALENDDIALSEVVAVGYGVQKKTDMTGSVAGVEVTSVVDKKATPSPDWKEYKEYLESELQHPVIGLPDKKVVVVVSFIVDERGKPGSFKILRSTNAGYNQVAIDIISKGSAWSPAITDSAAQPETIRMRLVFRPEKK